MRRKIPELVLLNEMAGARKKGDYSVLAEVNTEEDWDNLCTRQVNNCQQSI